MPCRILPPMLLQAHPCFLQRGLELSTGELYLETNCYGTAYGTVHPTTGPRTHLLLDGARFRVVREDTPLFVNLGLDHVRDRVLRGVREHLAPNAEPSVDGIFFSVWVEGDVVYAALDDVHEDFTLGTLKEHFDLNDAEMCDIFQLTWLRVFLNKVLFPSEDGRVE